GSSVGGLRPLGNELAAALLRRSSPLKRAVLPRLQEAPGVGVELGLVPCAVGGTTIRKWARGEHLYEQMVQHARAAAEHGEIEGVPWYQGESDGLGLRP